MAGRFCRDIQPRTIRESNDQVQMVRYSLTQLYIVSQSSRDLGAKLTSEDYKKACDERAFYRTFLRRNVFDVENTILLLPGGPPATRYRDMYDA